MTAGEAARLLLACVIGYLLGSVLPADILARRRGLDIRAVGDGNPGTVNAFLGLGAAAGSITAAYDLSVGVVAILCARLLGVPENGAYLAGIAALLGHRLPAFSGLRGGGKGVAASAGMLLYGVALALSQGWLATADLAALGATLLVVFALTRSDRFVAVVMLPLLVGRLAFAHTTWQFLAFMAVVATNLWFVQLAELRHPPGSLALHPLGSQPRH